VKSVNYKLSTAAYLKLGETNVFIIFFSIYSLTPSPSHFPSPSFSPIQRIHTNAGMRPCGRGYASALSRGCSADAGLRPRGRGRTRTRVRAYITPVRILIFCSFSPLPLVGVVGFAWQCPFRLAKGERVTSILRGIPLHFL
jgi:hypothetical protein